MIDLFKYSRLVYLIPEVIFLILAISVFDCELEPLRHEIVAFEDGEILDRNFVRGVIGRNEIVAVSGIFGKVEASFITQKFLDIYNIDCVILLSGAGAIEEGLEIGDVVAGDEYAEYDRILGSDAEKEIVKGCPRLINILKNDYPELKVGKIISGDAIVDSSEKKIKLKKRYDALALDMDSAVVAKVAKCNGVAFLSLKVILDLSDENTKDDFNRYYDDLSKIPAEMFAKFLSRHFIKGEC